MRWFKHLCWLYPNLEVRVTFYCLLLEALGILMLIPLAMTQSSFGSLSAPGAGEVLRLALVLFALIGLVAGSVFELMLAPVDPYARFED
jgi:hypothetical protein